MNARRRRIYYIGVLKENGGKMKIKDLNEAVADNFEGCRLFLKTMKSKELVDYDGILPSFGDDIILK